MDMITLSLLSEFSGEFGIIDSPESERFEQFAAWLVVRRHFNESTFLPSSLHTGGPNDASIDAIGVIVNNNLVADVDEVEELLAQNGFLDVTFVFVQAERSSHFDGAKIGTFGYGVRDFFGEAQMDRNEAAKNYLEIMTSIYSHAGKFKPGNPACYMYYVTTGSWQDDNNLKGRIKTETSLLEDTNLFSKVEFKPLGAVDIQRLHRQAKHHVSKEFSFDKRQSIPALEGVKEAYLGFIPATELLTVVRDEEGEIIKSLFYENIRDWQGYKGSINNEIRDTLDSDARDKFVLMNNGVTIIARTLQLTGDRFTISGFNIVNGCQTCNVLHDNSNRLTEAVQVPLRLICTQDQRVVESIIRATNRQTEVKEDQFFAMAQFAKKLEEYFKSFPLERRLYYERRSNQYDSESVEKQRIIVHPNLVRAVGAMFVGDAHITTKGYRTLRAQVGDKMFKDTDRMEPYYVAAYALYRLERLFPTKLSARYKAARYQILLAVRLRMSSEPLPAISSKDMKSRCEAMMDQLWDKDADKLFVDASADIDDVAGPDWDRDSVRIEKVTSAIFQKFGQRYQGKRQEKAAVAAG